MVTVTEAPDSVDLTCTPVPQPRPAHLSSTPEPPMKDPPDPDAGSATKTGDPEDSRPVSGSRCGSAGVDIYGSGEPEAVVTPEVTEAAGSEVISDTVSGSLQAGVVAAAVVVSSSGEGGGAEEGAESKEGGAPETPQDDLHLPPAPVSDLDPDSNDPDPDPRPAPSDVIPAPLPGDLDLYRPDDLQTRPDLDPGPPPPVLAPPTGEPETGPAGKEARDDLDPPVRPERRRRKKARRLTELRTLRSQPQPQPASDFDDYRSVHARHAPSREELAPSPPPAQYRSPPPPPPPLTDRQRVQGRRGMERRTRDHEGMDF